MSNSKPLSTEEKDRTRQISAAVYRYLFDKDFSNPAASWEDYFSNANDDPACRSEANTQRHGGDRNNLKAAENNRRSFLNSNKDRLQESLRAFLQV